MTDRAIEQYLDIKVSISVSISIKIYLSNLNIQYLFRPYRRSTGVVAHTLWPRACGGRRAAGARSPTRSLSRSRRGSGTGK